MKNLLFTCACALMLFTSCDKSSLDNGEREDWAFQWVHELKNGIEGDVYYEPCWQCVGSEEYKANGNKSYQTRTGITEGEASRICAKAGERHHEGENYGPCFLYRARLTGVPDSELKEGVKYSWALFSNSYRYGETTGKIYGEKSSAMGYFPSLTYRESKKYAYEANNPQREEIDGEKIISKTVFTVICQGVAK